MINIAYLSHYDATDVRSWSGTGRAMARCLSEADFKLNLIGPLKNQIHPVNVGRYLRACLAEFRLRRQPPVRVTAVKRGSHDFGWLVIDVYEPSPSVAIVSALIVLDHEAWKGPIYAW